MAATLISETVPEVLARLRSEPKRSGNDLTWLTELSAGAHDAYYAIAKRLPLNNAGERKLAERVTRAVAAGLITPNAAIDAARAVEVMRPRNPWGYFRACLNEKARLAGVKPSRIWRGRIGKQRKPKTGV